MDGPPGGGAPGSGYPGLGGMNMNMNMNMAGVGVGGQEGEDDTTTGQPSSSTRLPFICNICNKSFGRPNNLKSHMLSHSAEKPFKCDYCDQAFVRAYDQRRHQRSHTDGNKAFVCEYCNKGFTRHDALSRHQGLIKSSAPVCPHLDKATAVPHGAKRSSSSSSAAAPAVDPPAVRPPKKASGPKRSSRQPRSTGAMLAASFPSADNVLGIDPLGGNDRPATIADFQRESNSPAGPGLSYDPYGTGQPNPYLSANPYFTGQAGGGNDFTGIPTNNNNTGIGGSNQMDPPAHAFYGPPGTQGYRPDWAYGPYGGYHNHNQPPQVISPNPALGQLGYRQGQYPPHTPAYNMGGHSPYPASANMEPNSAGGGMFPGTEVPNPMMAAGANSISSVNGGPEYYQNFFGLGVPGYERQHPAVPYGLPALSAPQQQLGAQQTNQNQNQQQVNYNGPPELLLAITRLVSESLDPTAPIVHYPTFVARAMANRVDPLLRDTISWAAANIAARKGDPLLNEMEAAWGSERVAGLEDLVLEGLQARFMDWEAAGRHSGRHVLMPLLQSALLAIVAHSRAGRTDRARSLLAMAVPLHAAMRFDENGALATAAYRRNCHQMPLDAWIRAEEECRTCVVGYCVESAIAALDDNRPQIRLEDTPQCALPCPDTAWSLLPASVEKGMGVDSGLLVRLGVEVGDSAEPVGPILDRMQATNQNAWAADRKDPYSVSESVLWVQFPRGSPERERASQVAVAGFLNNGQQAAAVQMVLLNNKIRIVRRWFTAKGLSVHKPNEWDRSLGLATDESDTPPEALVKEAEERRAECEGTLKEFWALMPVVLKGLDAAADGRGIVEVGEERWGKVSGHRLLHWFLWYHANEIILNSPRNWIHTLRHPDPAWTTSPGFLHANAHAIGISRLIRSVVPLYSGDPWLQSERFPASILLPLLSAGMVHVHYLSQVRKASEMGQGPTSASVIRELVTDIQTCLQTLAHNVGYWENAKSAYAVFLRLADQTEDEWGQEAQTLKSLQGIGAILDPAVSTLDGV